MLYFPPIHPIGRTNRKGRNNTLTPAPDDPGSPYAIGSDEGGHDADPPRARHASTTSTGSWRRRASTASRSRSTSPSSASPDHPWIKEHPEWFDWRPDGTIKYAENPPKKYEDIVNCPLLPRARFPSIWYAMRDIVPVLVRRTA